MIIEIEEQFEPNWDLGDRAERLLPISSYPEEAWNDILHEITFSRPEVAYKRFKDIERNLLCPFTQTLLYTAPEAAKYVMNKKVKEYGT